MDLMVKLLDDGSAQTKASLPSCNFTSCKEATIQQKHLFPPVSSHRVKKQQFYANPFGSYLLNFGEKKYSVGMN
jgi:hypothetical protein